MPTHPALPWTLRAVARLERAGGVRSPRLTEPGFAKWHRIRRNLGWREFASILHQDLAESFPLPFDVAVWKRDPFADLGDDEAGDLIESAAQPEAGDAHAFLRAAARGAGPPGGRRVVSAPAAPAP